MNVSKEIEKLENSALKLTVTVSKKDAAETYKSTIAKYAKELQIPGFRKGKVPVSVLENKYGKAIKNEVAGELMDKSIQQIFEEMDKEESDLRPLAFSQPEIEDIPELDLNKDYVFAVTYDIMPKVQVKDYSDVEVKEPQVTLTDDDLKDELQAIRERNAMIIDKKDTDAVCKDDIITIDYSELDDKNEEISGSKREDFVFTVGTGANIFKIDDDVIGMKKDETKEITKTYADDFEDKDLAGKTKKIKVTVKAIKIKQMPELDDDLAQDVNEKYKTLEDLKNDLKKKMQVSLDKQLKEVKVTSLLEQLVERNPVAVPASMLKAQLDYRWREMAQQFQCSTEQLEKFMSSAGQSKDSLLEQWKEETEKQLKSRIIVESLLKEKNYEATDDEIDAKYKEVAESSGMKYEDVKKQYDGNPQYKEFIADEIKEDKLYAEMFSKIKIKKGEKKTFAELFAREQN